MDKTRKGNAALLHDIDILLQCCTPNYRISSLRMGDLTSARSQTFMTVSNMTCYTTGIVSSHCSSSCSVIIMLHLSCSHLGLKVAYDLYIQSMHLADLVIPQEYSITHEEKLEIAESICCPLLQKI